MDLFKIIVTMMTAAGLIFLRTANLKAEKQKVTAIRLQSYLNYWKGVILDKELFRIFYVGIKWNEEIREIIKKGGGPETLIKLKNEKKEIITEIRKAIETESSDFKFDKDAFLKNLNKIPKNLLDELMKHATLSEQNIIEGKTFISDEDASLLTPYIAQTCVELKMNLISMISMGVILLIRIASENNDFELKNNANEIAELTWKGILLSKDIDTLSSFVDGYAKKNVFELTIENIGIKL